MRQKGIDHIPSNDFSLYDHMLDMAGSPVGYTDCQLASDGVTAATS